MGLTRFARGGSRPAASARRLATPLLVAHVALILFSTLALTTFLAGPPPEWLQTEANQRVLRLGWTYSGPTYVVLAALAALAHAAARSGWTRATLLLVAGTLISLGAELLGTSTGLPFGPYSYTSLLGWRVAGLVPFPIPLSWFYMLYASLAMLGRLLPPRDDRWSKLRWAALAGLVLTAWDVAMDPAMSFATPHWIWHTRGFFYGMPLLNWFGWWLTGSVVARAMLAIVPPSEFTARVSPSRFPLVLYAVNGVFPIAICLRHGLWWAAGLGTVAMAVPLILAMRARSGAPAATVAPAAASDTLPTRFAPSR